jgi:hypothetical protein
MRIVIDTDVQQAPATTVQPAPPPDLAARAASIGASDAGPAPSHPSTLVAQVAAAPSQPASATDAGPAPKEKR